MPDIEVRLGPIIGHEDLAVLERVHRAGVDVEVRIELLHDDAKTTASQKVTERCSGQAFAERGDHSTGNKDVLRDGLVEFEFRMFHHGIQR